MRSLVLSFSLLLGSSFTAAGVAAAQPQPLDPGYGYVQPQLPQPPPPPVNPYPGSPGYYYPPQGYAAPIYSYPPPPVYYRAPAPMPRRVYRVCDASCSLERPRFFSIGVRLSSLGIDQTINGKDVVLGGVGFQMRFRNRGHFGVEAGLDFLHGDFGAGGTTRPEAGQGAPTTTSPTGTSPTSPTTGSNSGGYFHVGDVSRDSVPFTVSALIYIFPNTDARIFNLYFLGGVGVVGTKMSLLDQHGVRTEQDFTEYEMHVGVGSELRFHWFAIDASMRALGLSRDDSQPPASYYAGVEGGPVPASSVGYQGTLAGTIWF